MSRIVVALLAIALVGGSISRPAEAETCVIDAVPAATLLLPYFEIDFGKSRSKAEDWVFSINNAGPAPVVAHVVLWTDMSVPTFDFDVFLTGFDVQTISLADLFFNAFVPSPPPYSGFQTLGELRDAHTGKPVDGRCYGRPSGKKARGYVTIDSVDVAETLLTPADGGYFDNVANDQNVLWGQFYMVKNGYIASENLVSIEAGSSSSGYTFYGRYVGFDGRDEREPLAESWFARYFTANRSKTFLIAWRDSTVEQEPFECGNLEGGWYPLGQTKVIAFNEQEDAVELFIDPERFPLPAETQQVRLRTGAFPLPFTSGALLLDLGTEDDLQSFVMVRQDFKNRRSLHMAHPIALDAEILENGNLSSGPPRVSSACGSAPSVADPVP